eukprot:GSChrysophyteH1.ASY1.ANO1.3046.1 assembled CDS
MYRGRGALEVKPSTNPFFVRTSSDFGVKPEDHVAWSGAVNPDFAKSMKVTRPESFSFLYTRESDNIGGKIENPLDTKPRVPTKTEFLKKWRAEQMDRKDLAKNTLNFPNEDTRAVKKTPEEVDRILSKWKQGTKQEDPRYTSTSNTYGFKPPTVATFVADRAGRPQGFSNSFQGIKPQNSGLNTGLTKSTVHPSLDPQFA